MKAPNDLVFLLAFITGLLGVAVIWTSGSALFKRSRGSVATNILRLFLLLGIGLLATASYMASWGFVVPQKEQNSLPHGSEPKPTK